MLQHGLGGLRASATQLFVEFVDVYRVRTQLAVEDYATLIFGGPVDRVHCGRINRCVSRAMRLSSHSSYFSYIDIEPGFFEECFMSNSLGLLLRI